MLHGASGPCLATVIFMVKSRDAIGVVAASPPSSASSSAVVAIQAPPLAERPPLLGAFPPSKESLKQCRQAEKSSRGEQQGKETPGSASAPGPASAAGDAAPPADGVAEAGTMAASPGDGIPTQLAAVLGYTIERLRITVEVPPRISVIDVIQSMTQMTQDNAGFYFRRIRGAHPEVSTNCANWRFPGERQRDTPVADVRAVVELSLIHI